MAGAHATEGAPVSPQEAWQAARQRTDEHVAGCDECRAALLVGLPTECVEGVRLCDEEAAAWVEAL